MNLRLQALSCATAMLLLQACGTNSVQPVANTSTLNAVAVAPETTGGQGGVEGSYTTTVDGVEMKIWAPEGAKDGQVLRAAFYFHGDGAQDYFNDWGYKRLLSYAKQQGMLFVAALSPNRTSWWHEARFAGNMANALASLESQYNLQRDRYLFSGVSGGSTFLTMLFVPAFGNLYAGSIAAMCGGAVPRTFKYDVETFEKALIPIHYTYGSEDFLAKEDGNYGPVIPSSIERYQKLGFAVETKVLPGLGHCEFDTQDEILNIWRS